MNDGQTRPAIVGVTTHRDREEAVDACVRHPETDKGRMCYCLCRKRELPGGSGVVESGCKRIGYR